MASLTRVLPRLSQRTAIMSVTAVLAVVGAGLTPWAQDLWAQDQGVAIAKDAIFARKILMDTISTNMDELETMTASDKGVNLAEGREHADTISVMLMAFPHLFAAETNQWKSDVERDPGGTPTPLPMSSSITRISTPRRQARRRSRTMPAARSKRTTSRNSSRS